MEECMANIHNDRFKDLIDKLNKMAYMIVDGNAKLWASKAVQKKIITYKDRARIEQLVDLRNSMGHGNSAYINVGPNEVNEVNRYVKIMSKTSDQLKGSGEKSVKRERGSSSGAYRDYFQKMYGYQRGTPSSSSSSSYKKKYEFVSNPPRSGLFGKTPDGYAWVICNHSGEFLMETAYVWWSSSFDRAVAFKSEKEAQKVVDSFLKDSTSWGSSNMPFFRVRCVKIL